MVGPAGGREWLGEEVGAGVWDIVFGCFGQQAWWKALQGLVAKCCVVGETGDPIRWWWGQGIVFGAIEKGVCMVAKAAKWIDCEG